MKKNSEGSLMNIQKSEPDDEVIYISTGRYQGESKRRRK